VSVLVSVPWSLMCGVEVDLASRNMMRVRVCAAVELQ
jgi:hypothetical protein